MDKIVVPALRIHKELDEVFVVAARYNAVSVFGYGLTIASALGDASRLLSRAYEEEIEVIKA